MSLMIDEGTTLLQLERMLVFLAIRRTVLLEQAALLLGVTHQMVAQRVHEWGWNPRAIRSGRMPERGVLA